MAFERKDTNTIVTLHSSGEEGALWAGGEVVGVQPLDGPPGGKRRNGLNTRKITVSAITMF